MPLETAAIFFLANLLLKQGISSEYFMVISFAWAYLTCEERELRITKWKFLLTVGFEPGTFRVRNERAERWAIRDEKYRSPTGDRILP